MKLHKHNEALEIFNETLALQEQFELNGILNNDIVVTLNNIGLCLMEMNKLPDSYSNLERAYSLCLKSLQSDSTFSSTQLTKNQLANTLNNLGLYYLCVKSYNQTMYCFNDALSYYNTLFQSLDETTEDFCIVWNNLGLCYMSVKRSLVYYEESDSITGADSKIAALCNNIGLCLMQYKLFNDSLYFFINSLSLYQKTTPSSNQNVAAVLHNIALVYMNFGEFEDSFQFLQNALNLYRNSCADLESDPNIAEILHSMSLCKKRMGEFTESLTYFEKSLAIQRFTVTDANDKSIHRTLYNSGVCLYELMNHQTPFQKTHFEMTLQCINYLVKK